MMSVKSEGGGRNRRWWIIVAALVMVMATGLVTVGGPLFGAWLRMRPIDHTVAHGDSCLNEPQGNNLRCWELVLPTEVEAGAPLVIDLHGFQHRPSTQMGLSEFEQLVESEGFVLAVPYGIQWSWNGGGDPWPSENELVEEPGTGCCGHALNEGLDDVGFIRDLIHEVEAEHGIDRSRIYLSGFSNGCMLAQRLAAEASDLIAGVACMSGFLLTEVPNDYQPVPVMVFHGTSDDVTPYEPGFWPGAVANLESWRTNNGCTDEPVEVWREGAHDMIQSSDCRNGATVALVTLDDVGHATYPSNGEFDVDTTLMAWEFLITSATN